MIRQADPELLAPGSALDPIMGWRAWALSARPDGSQPQLRPIGWRGNSWPPRRPARARCRRSRSHQPPTIECTCGLYATHDAALLRQAKDPAVVGSVALWGRVVEHEYGFRAELAYPQRLRLVCYLCFWQWGLECGGHPDVAARLPFGRLVPLCGPHVDTSRRYGFPVRQAVDAAEVQQRLLATYAVDLLPA